MAGIVEKVEVKAGQKVSAGDLLCVVSAMKMEVKVTAPCDGEVASVAVPSVGKAHCDFYDRCCYVIIAAVNVV